MHISCDGPEQATDGGLPERVHTVWGPELIPKLTIGRDSAAEGAPPLANVFA